MPAGSSRPASDLPVASGDSPARIRERPGQGNRWTRKTPEGHASAAPAASRDRLVEAHPHVRSLFKMDGIDEPHLPLLERHDQ